VSCDAWTEALSARADGEPLGVEPRLLDAHLAGCADCRAFAAHLEAGRRPVHLGEAPAMPDLSRRVVEANALADRMGRWRVARALLCLVAVEIVVLSAPELVLGRGGSSAEHAGRHLGAFSVAYAVGLLVVAVRPARARSILPVALVLALALTITAVVDVVDGRVPLLGEAVHLPEVISVLLVWLLARPAPSPEVTRSGGAGPRLVEVDDDRRRGIG
jgi:predicted anti-sigma-YlaC factor YlaD